MAAGHHKVPVPDLRPLIQYLGAGNMIQLLVDRHGVKEVVKSAVECFGAKTLLQELIARWGMQEVLRHFPLVNIEGVIREILPELTPDQREELRRWYQHTRHL